MNQTSNYQLCQWDSDDRILRTDFNDLTEKVDTALAEQAAQISTKGNCCIVYGTYKGAGRTGVSNAQTLIFNGTPLFLAVFGTPFTGMMLMARGVENSFGFVQSDYKINNVTWGENSVTWYSTTNEYYQMNDSRNIYYYIALLAADE